MSKSKKRLKSREMRLKGESVKSIASLLGVSKSSVSVWVRDIVLTKQQRDRLKNNSIIAGNKGRMIGAEINRQKRLKTIERNNQMGVQEVGQLSSRDLSMIALGLFWSEGNKNGSRFIFVNSDPAMILIMFKFITKIWKIDIQRIRINIQINLSHKNRIDEVLIFWSNLLKLPHSHFKKTYYIKTKSKKVYDNHDSYFGIARMTVEKGSDLMYRMLGLINAIKRRA